MSNEILSASFCPSDGHAEPLKTLGSYKAAAERNGVIFFPQEEVINMQMHLAITLPEARIQTPKIHKNL